jgi:uncharacterized membrane protein
MTTTTSPPTTSASPLDRHAPPVSSESKSRRGTAALVLGIVGVLTTLIPIVGVIVGIIALVLGLTSRADCRRRGRPAPWQAIAGTVLGSLAILGSVGLMIAAAIVS